MTKGNHWCYYRNPRHFRQNCFKLKKKETRYDHNQASNNINGNRDREMYDSQDVVSAATSVYVKFTDDIWICDRGACGHYFSSSKSLFNLWATKPSITVCDGKSMTATKVGSLKFQVIQANGYGLDITLHEVKFIPELWVNFSVLRKTWRMYIILATKAWQCVCQKDQFRLLLIQWLGQQIALFQGSRC
jgi:hypothetical protein